MNIACLASDATALGYQHNAARKDEGAELFRKAPLRCLLCFVTARGRHELDRRMMLRHA